MNLSPVQKELISRTTMAIVAVGLGVGATKLVLFARHLASSENAQELGLLGGVLILLVVVMSILSLTFGCFVFCAWDKRKSNIGLVMVIGDKIQACLTLLFENFRRF